MLVVETQPTEPGPTPTRRGIWVRLLLSAVLAAAFVAALTPYLQAVPDDLSIPLATVGAYLVTLLPYHLLRAGRWVFLLRPLQQERGPLPGVSEITRIGLAGYMWIALLPFRLGEFARPLFLSQRSHVRVTQALGTVAIERAVDGLMVCGLFFVGMAGAHPRGETHTLYVASYAVMGAFAAALLGMLAAARWPQGVAGLARTMLRWASPKLANWAATTVEGVAQGFRALPSPLAVVAFSTTTMGYWLANAAGMWVLARGCGLPLTGFEAVATLAVMNIALLIPGGPAQLGVFQTGVALALHLFVSSEEVLGAGSKLAFYLYVCQLGTIVALGLASQLSLRLDWRAVLGMRPKN